MHPHEFEKLTGKLTAQPLPTYRLLSFDDLKLLGIVNNRMTLMRWIKHQGFPEPIRLSKNTIRWRASRVEEWVAERESAGAEA